MATSRNFSPFHKTWNQYQRRSLSEVEVEEKLKQMFPSTTKKEGRVLYEPVPLSFTSEVRRRYIPDFIIQEKAWILEVKGFFSSADRAKMLLVKRQFPNLDIRFVFDGPNTRLSRTSKTTYAMWADKNGFPWCATNAFPPPEWRTHIPSSEQVRAFVAATGMR